MSLAAVWTARRPLRALHNETTLENLLKRLRISGTKPTRAQTIEAQKQRKLEHARAYSAASIGRIAYTFVLGVGVPFAAVLIITAQGSWLFPQAPVLVDALTRSHIAHPDTAQLTAFAVDLFLKGGLNDVIEVFELDFGSVRHASDNLLYASYILLFRLVADLFVLSLIFYAGRTAVNWRTASRRVMQDAAAQHSGG